MSQLSQSAVGQAAGLGLDRNTFNSPPPIPAAITPPRSSSQPVSFLPARTPTPTHSHLSSPPPTVKRQPQGRKRAALDTDSLSQSSDQELDSANPEQLRIMLAAARDEARSARTSAAHHRLQYELLSMESSEEIKRMGVELDMARREVDVLQRSKPQSPTSVTYPPAQAALEWKIRCHALELENEDLSYRLADAKAALLEREDRNGEQIEQLRERIRENRKHATQLKRSGALSGDPLPPVYPPAHGQHEAYNSTPRNTNSDEPFAQLLRAGEVLRQDAASTPSTPLGPRSRQQARNQNSLTSLPSTPYRSAAHTQGPYYLNPPHTPSAVLSPHTHSNHHQSRRRESRDSTISASDEAAEAQQSRVPQSEDEADDADDASEDNELDIPTSNASQEAANMLRKSASFRQAQQASFEQTRENPLKAPTANMMLSGSGLALNMSGRIDAGAAAKQTAKDLMQSKMYGYQITKPGAPGQAESIKRRFYDEGPGGETERERESVSARPRKRGRHSTDVATEGLGLGIGTWGLAK